MAVYFLSTRTLIGNTTLKISGVWVCI